MVRQAGAAPPQVVLRAELHVGADERHLDRDEHGQHAHHEAEAEDVVEVPLPAAAARVSAARPGEAASAAPLPCRLPRPCRCYPSEETLGCPGLVHGGQRLGWDQSLTQQSGLATPRCMTSRPATANCARAPYTRAQAQAPGAGTRAQSRAGRQGARARSQQTGAGPVRAPSRQGARACQMDVIAKYSSTKMVPKGSSPAARNSTVGCEAQCGGGTWRGIWLVRVG